MRDCGHATHQAKPAFTNYLHLYSLFYFLLSMFPVMVLCETATRYQLRVKKFAQVYFSCLCFWFSHIQYVTCQ